MSHTEVNHYKGQPYGGVPHEVLLAKLEETDPDLVSEVTGRDEFYDYDDYARGEIVDWSQDAPFLESDQARRDPAISRSMLNLRFGGTRGSNPDLPRHPELFFGFTGNDPRGVSNDPRFDEMRRQVMSRAAGLEVRMGNNDDNHLAERPWTSQNISYAMKDLHRQAQHRLKIFSIQKENNPLGRRTVADEVTQGELWSEAKRHGDESFTGGGNADNVTAAERFSTGDYAPANEAWGGNARKSDTGVRGVYDAPWHWTTGDTRLGVARYSQTRGAGRAFIGANAQGGGKTRAEQVDQEWAASRQNTSANRRVLSVAMAHALRRVKHDQAPARTYEQFTQAGAGLMPPRDVARAYRNATEDQQRRQELIGAGIGSGASLVPSADTSRIGRETVAHASSVDHLANVGSIVSGLREGSAAGRRRIAYSVRADGLRDFSTTERFAGTRGGLKNGTDYSRMASLAETYMARTPTTEGLTIHSYRGAVPVADDNRTRRVAEGDTTHWHDSRGASQIGKSQVVGDGFAGTQFQTKLGIAADDTFGRNVELSTISVGAIAKKPLRPNVDETENFSDEVREFGS